MSSEDSSSNKTTTTTSDVDPTITGGKVWKPFVTALNDAQLKEVEDRISLNEFTLDINGSSKVFKRRKIKTRDFAVLEDIRAQHASAPPNSTERSKLFLEQYRKAANFYLGMTDEEFDVCDYEELKKIIDAQNIRTNYGVPNQ